MLTNELTYVAFKYIYFLFFYSLFIFKVHVIYCVFNDVKVISTRFEERNLYENKSTRMQCLKIKI